MIKTKNINHTYHNPYIEGIVNAIIVANTPTTKIETRITQMISISEALCLKISLYTFLANIELADKTEESAEDITAAETAPRPKKDTKSGVKCCKTIGKIILVWSSVNGYGPVYAVSFHAEILRELLKDSSGEMLFFLFTSCFSYGADKNWRNCH